MIGCEKVIKGESERECVRECVRECIETVCRTSLLSVESQEWGRKNKSHNLDEIYCKASSTFGLLSF